jgi:hypothetical protein
MEYRFGHGVFERKAFLLMLFFGFAGTGITVFEVGFQSYLLRSLSGSASFQLTAAAFGLLMNGYSFLVNPVLLFVAFYRICGRDFSDRAASTLISVVLGVVVGAVFGWVVVGGVFALTTEYALLSSLGLILQVFQSRVAGNVLLALAAVAFAPVVRRWDEKLVGEGQELKVQRPLEVSVASAVYVLGGVLALFVWPFLFVLQLSTGSAYLALVTAAVVLVVIGGVIQLFIGYGVYKGRRWGWLVAFAASLIGLVLNAATLGLLAFEETNWTLIPVAEAVFALIALFLDLAVLGLLLPLRSKLYCRMVDPPASS